jgi:hypothetical protein
LKTVTGNLDVPPPSLAERKSTLNIIDKVQAGRVIRSLPFAKTLLLKTKTTDIKLAADEAKKGLSRSSTFEPAISARLEIHGPVRSLTPDGNRS